MSARLEALIYDCIKDIGERNELLVTFRSQAARIAKLEAALRMAENELINAASETYNPVYSKSYKEVASHIRALLKGGAS